MAKNKANASSLTAGDILKIIQKHYFWMLLPVLVLVAFILKNMAMGKIKTDFEQSVSSVNSEKKAVDDIASNSKHPNSDTIKAIQSETETLTSNVKDTWKLMYDEQKKRNKWPRRLSSEFLKIVENAKFESPIGVGKPYILEDYAGMMSANLPQLLIDVNRRRYQVRCYQFVREEGAPPTGRFEPVYIDRSIEQADVYTEPLLYLFGKDGRVYQYHESKQYIEEIKESALRQRLSEIPAAERTEYWVETDPMITNPGQYVSGGSRTADSTAAMPAMMRMGTPGAGSIPGDGIDPALMNFNQNEYSFNPRDIANNEILPGLPTLEERSRQVGNVDWQNPEIFSLLNWREAVPRSIEVWYLQEDLWVYQALLRVVMSSNGILNDQVLEGTADARTVDQVEENVEEADSKQQSAANNIGKSAIKCIESLMIGQQAASSWSEIKNLSLTGVSASGEGGMMMPGMMMPGMMPMGMPGAAGAGGAMPMPMPMPMPTAGAGGGGGGGMPGMPMMPMMPMGMPGSGDGEVTEADIRTALKDNRYLDAQDEPLTADSPSPFAEFKRMPIIMKLIVDQRRIPEILVNCANCSMPIDVRHVRIAPDNLQSGGGTAAAAMPVGAGVPAATAAGALPGGAAGGGVSLGRSALGETSGYGSDAIRISIYGVINIFNEPDPAIFGTGIDELEKQAKTGPQGTAQEAPQGAQPSPAAAPQQGEAPSAEGAPAEGAPAQPAQPSPEEPAQPAPEPAAPAAAEAVPAN